VFVGCRGSNIVVEVLSATVVVNVFFVSSVLIGTLQVRDLATTFASQECSNRLINTQKGRQEPRWPAPSLSEAVPLNELRGLSPHANYTDRAAAAGRRS